MRAALAKVSGSSTARAELTASGASRELGVRASLAILSHLSIAVRIGGDGVTAHTFRRLNRGKRPVFAPLATEILSR